MELNEAVTQAKKVVESIPTKSGKNWDKKTRFIDLVEEVGELANAILLEEGDKFETRRRAELIDSICDVLMDILLLAGDYGIDLDKEYSKVLEDIEKRNKKGEFVD